MKDKDIIKTVVGLKAAADLNAIRAHLDKQEKAASEARIQAAHEMAVKGLWAHYEFILRDLHKVFLKQRENGDAYALTHFIAHCIWVAPAIYYVAKGGIALAKGDFACGVLAVVIVLGLIGFLFNTFSSTRRRHKGIFEMFSQLWTGDPQHDLDTYEVRQLAQKILEHHAKADAAFAFKLSSIAQKDPEWQIKAVMNQLAG